MFKTFKYIDRVTLYLLTLMIKNWDCILNLYISFSMNLIALYFTKLLVHDGLELKIYIYINWSFTTNTLRFEVHYDSTSPGEIDETSQKGLFWSRNLKDK